MRNVISLLAMFLWATAYSQKPTDEVVYTIILDTLVNRVEFDFYYPHLFRFETYASSEDPLDSIIVFSPETYEDVKRSVLDIIRENDSLNVQEARLFKQRVHFPNGLYIIGKIKSQHLHKKISLEDYIELESYPNVENLTELSGAMLKKGSIGPYTTKPSTTENIENYKYTIKAHLAFSGVLWDRTNTYCLVECGYHYRISDKHQDKGASGGGCLFLMKNENGIPGIIKIIGLWEE